jgi:hypothetical protein
VLLPGLTPIPTPHRPRHRSRHVRNPPTTPRERTLRLDRRRRTDRHHTDCNISPTMQATGALSFRSLVNKIHPQLPLNPRESTQLLNILTTSFQHHLDQHHPPGASAFRKPSPATAGSPPTSTPRPSHLHQFHAQASANEHIRSVLANPLVTKKPRATSFSNLHGSSPTDHQLLEERPLEWLEEKIATGTVILPHVTICLERLWKIYDHFHLKELRAASKIIGWLQASSQIPEGDLLSYSKGTKKLHALLTSMLVLEGRQDIVWSWVTADLPHLLPTRRRLLYQLLRAETKYTSGLESAMKTILRLSSEKMVDKQPLHSAMWAAIFPHLSSRASNVSEEIYRAFIVEARTWSRNLLMDNAYLSLFHPVAPSPKHALIYIKNLSSSGTAMDELKPAARYGHVTLCLSLTKLLLNQNQHEDAKFILHFAQENFPLELGLESTPVAKRASKTRRLSEPSADEAANLQLLDGLVVS